MTSVPGPRPESRNVIHRAWKMFLRSSANNMLTTPRSDELRANFANNHCAMECRDSMRVLATLNPERPERGSSETSAVRMRVPGPNMEPTAQQSGAIYFKRHKGSKRRAALFRQLRASPANQTHGVKQQTFGNAHIAQGLRSGQLWLRGLKV